MEGREGLYCLGFFETKSHNGKDVNQMRIENIAGCEHCKKEESVDDVLVVYCAKHPAHKFTTVIGWNFPLNFSCSGTCREQNTI